MIRNIKKKIRKDRDFFRMLVANDSAHQTAPRSIEKKPYVPPQPKFLLFFQLCFFFSNTFFFFYFHFFYFLFFSSFFSQFSFLFFFFFLPFSLFSFFNFNLLFFFLFFFPLYSPPHHFNLTKCTSSRSNSSYFFLCCNHFEIQFSFFFCIFGQNLPFLKIFPSQNITNFYIFSNTFSFDFTLDLFFSSFNFSHSQNKSQALISFFPQRSHFILLFKDFQILS